MATVPFKRGGDSYFLHAQNVVSSRFGEGSNQLPLRKPRSTSRRIERLVHASCDTLKRTGNLGGCSPLVIPLDTAEPPPEMAMEPWRVAPDCTAVGLRRWLVACETRQSSTPDGSARYASGPFSAALPSESAADVCQVLPPTCVQVSKRPSRGVRGVVSERVGFVPDEPSSINNLGRIGTARSRQIL
jgi:hypothetical protein